MVQLYRHLTIGIIKLYQFVMFEVIINNIYCFHNKSLGDGSCDQKSSADLSIALSNYGTKIRTFSEIKAIVPRKTRIKQDLGYLCHFEWHNYVVTHFPHIHVERFVYSFSVFSKSSIVGNDDLRSSISCLV